jgi:hypothetical protein
MLVQQGGQEPGPRRDRCMTEFVEQRDAPDEGRLETGGSILVGEIVVDPGEVVRPSQELLASSRRTWSRHR